MAKIKCTELHVKLVMLARHYANELNVNSLDRIVEVINKGDAANGIPAMNLGVTKDNLITAFEAYQYRNEDKPPRERAISAAAKLASEAKEEWQAKAEIERLGKLLAGEIEEPKTRKQKRQAKKFRDDIQKTIDELEKKLSERKAEIGVPSKVESIVASMLNRHQQGKDIRTLVRALAKEVNSEAIDNGERLTAEDLRDRVHDIATDIIDDGSWTTSDTQDAISGYGEFTPASTEKKAVELTRIKQELQLLSKIRVLQGGRLPRKSGAERQKLSERGISLQRDVTALLTQHNMNPEIANDPAKLASALQKIKNRLRNQKIDLQNQINASKRSRRVFRQVPRDAEAKALEQQVKDLRKQLDEKVGKDDTAEIERLNKRIAEVEKKIADRDLSVRKTSNEDSDRVKKLKETLKSLNKHLAGMRADSGQRKILTEKIERLNKEIQSQQFEEQKRAKGEAREVPSDIAEMSKRAAYLTRIRNLMRSIKDKQRQREQGPDEQVKRPPETDPTIIKLVAERNLQAAKLRRLVEEMKPKTPMDRILNAISSYRSLRASGDLPPLGRQGFINLLTHPIISTGAFIRSMVAMVNPQRAAMLDIEMRDQPDFDDMVSAGLYFAPLEGGSMTQREEEMMGDLAEKIPLIGRFIIKPGARGYVTLLNQMSYHIMRRTMRWIPKDAPNRDVALKALASKLNDFRGRGAFSNLKGDQKSLANRAERIVQSDLARVGFFSLRNWIAKFKLASLYHLWSPLVGRGTWRTSAMAAADYAKFIFGVKIGIFLLKASGLVEPDDDDNDLRSYMLGKVKVGGTTVDLSGQMGSELGFWARLLTATDANGKDLERSDVIMNRIRGKLSPQVAAFIEVVITGKDYNGKPLRDKKSIPNTMGLIAEHLVGEPPDPVRKILTGQFSNAFDNMGFDDIARIYPTSMAGQDVAKALENEDKPAAFALSLATLLGFGLQDETDRKEAKQMMKQYKAEGRY